ncbi:dynamin family protein [Microbispora hainanensis]|jgi:hypothetical protein|uniref:Dynamin family protein n=1 Tax=Microbispora hainanensis TaxID=568844 RepID=A0ABZ1SJG1_9ACTN|nr:dynamin family protein [Microbispora hainanensis]
MGAAAGGGPLCAAVARLCEEAEGRFPDGPARTAVREVAARLSEPTLRVAVGGRLNAGKSTLVNVLLGRRLAATDATECTRVVTWFRHGDRDRIEVTPRDGRPYEIPMGPGGIPADLGLPHGQISSVTVHARNDVLRGRHTVVDTPGLDSPTGLDGDSLVALRQADALVYVMPLPGKGDEEALAAFRAALSGSGLSIVNAVGVLSRIDELGTGKGDPWPEATRIAAGYEARLRALLSGVVPVVGMLAQATLADGLTDQDARWLRDLAGAAPAVERKYLISSLDDLLAWRDCPVSPEGRRRLWRLLGGYGLRESLALIDTGTAGRAELAAALWRRSGVEGLFDVVRQRFVDGADGLRASAAVAALDRIGWGAVSPAERMAVATLRAGLSRVRAEPAMRRAELAATLSSVVAAGAAVPAELEGDVLVLLDDTGKGDVATPARIARLKRAEASFSRSTVRLARLAREMCEAELYRSRRS